MDGREKIAAYNGRERTMGWKENATRERERERERIWSELLYRGPRYVSPVTSPPSSLESRA